MKRVFSDSSQRSCAHVEHVDVLMVLPILFQCSLKEPFASAPVRAARFKPYGEPLMSANLTSPDQFGGVHAGCTS